jgi:hypothetical protein
MDEIELLKRFRREVPEADEERIRVARAAFMEGLNPTDARRIGQGPGERHRPRWAVAMTAVAAAVAMALVLSAILGGRGGAEPAAAAALHHVARIAAHQEAVAPPTSGQYVYTKSVGTQYVTYVPGNGLASFLYGIPQTRQAWIGTDGSGRLAQTPGEIAFPTAADRAAWVAAGSPKLEGATDRGDQSFGSGGLHYFDLSGLPTDPAKLQALVEARTVEGGPSGDWETFAILGDMLKETYASPALRAAVYDIAANLPGVEFVGTTTDASGRSGIGVAYTHGGTRDELIFDPKTSALLGENEVIVDPSQLGDGGMGPVGPAGSLLYSVVFLGSGIVDSTTATP